MPTCLFTGDDLLPTTRKEHAIPRVLAGRIRSRRVSSDRFNNATSNGFDDLLAAPYAIAFNYLAPLLPTEADQASLEIEVAGDRHYCLSPGGEVGIRGMRVERRDAVGHPAAVVHEDPAAVLRFAANAGWPPDGWRQTDEIATTAWEGRRRDPVLHPNMEIAALKCGLLAFDEVLADLSLDPFTRSGWLATSRDAVRDIVINGADPTAFLYRVCWGLAPNEHESIRQLRRELIQDEETPFEHVLIASGDPRNGALDLAWILADMDVWTFRLTRLWNGPAFTAIAGCGTLRGTRRWEPAVVRECRWQLGQRTSARAVQRADVRVMETIADEIAERRHGAFKRAFDLVERRVDDVVRAGILSLARFPKAEPVMYAGSTLIAHGLERRLRRLFFSQCADAENLRLLRATVADQVARMPEEVRDQAATPDDATGAGIAWDEWVACHRRVLDAVAPTFGLPGYVYSVGVTEKPIVR